MVLNTGIWDDETGPKKNMQIRPHATAPADVPGVVWITVSAVNTNIPDQLAILVLAPAITSSHIPRALVMVWSLLTIDTSAGHSGDSTDRLQRSATRDSSYVRWLNGVEGR